MRPLRLTMQALGPYPNREIIDFRDAIKAGLFGIYGPTGSGKSTIFSAMTFALFGKAAKSEQDTPSLRSDHASPNLPTEVEFVFDIGNRRFVILRRPEQSRPKRHSEGETQSKHEAFLFDATGLALDQINGTHRGTIIEEKKVSAVDPAIENLLGYGVEQFRQIVLLPQGRFEKFLSANTNERLNILRDLFDVSLYQKLAEKLKTDAEQIEQRVRSKRELCNSRLASEGFESTDALIAGISNAEKELAELKEGEEAARAILTQAQKAFNAAQTLEDKFKASEKAQEELVALQAKEGDMNKLMAQVERAEKARRLLDLESAAKKATESVTEAKQKLETAQSANENAKEIETSASEAHEREKERAHEIEDLGKHLENLKRHKETLEGAKMLKKNADEAQSAEKEAKTKLQEAQTQINERQNKKQEKTNELKAAQTAKVQRDNINTQLTKLNNDLATAKIYEKTVSMITESEKNLDALRSDYETKRDYEHEAQEKFETTEKRLSEAQAFHLASKLSAGEPCPVCGATDHPNPITGSIEYAGLDKAFREAKTAYETANAVVQESEKDIAGVKSELEVHKKNLERLPKPQETVAAIGEQIASKKASLENLGHEIDMALIEVEIENLAEEIASLETTRDNLQDEYSNKQKSAASTLARYEEKITSVPEDLRDPDTLSTKINDTTNAVAERKNRKKVVEEATTAARESAINAKKDLEATSTALSECNARQSQAIDNFNSRLKEVGLSQEEFIELKPAIERIDEDRKTIEEYRRALGIAKHTAKTHAEQICFSVRPDLEKIESEQNQAQGNLDNATDQRAKKEQTLSHLKKLRDDLAETLLKLKEEEKNSGPLRHLAAITNGDNQYKLDLETFAIGAMFDRVLESANLRLGPMTANRYQIERDTEGSGRGRRGLGIQVFDIHTGKTRSTATLSGGETFIAALALALGLADIVESASGKVRLDTIFIDEGFGSLDTENGAGTLDQVLNVLNALVSQNRSVGLISHVPLVQEAVPNGFYVRKTLTGSTIETRQDV